jgi:hypothetical protein
VVVLVFCFSSSSLCFSSTAMDFRGADLAMCGRLAAQNQWETSLYCLGIGLGKVLVEMVGVDVRRQSCVDRKSCDFV